MRDPHTLASELTLLRAQLWAWAWGSVGGFLSSCPRPCSGCTTSHPPTSRALGWVKPCPVPWLCNSGEATSSPLASVSCSVPWAHNCTSSQGGHGATWVGSEVTGDRTWCLPGGPGLGERWAMQPSYFEPETPPSLAGMSWPLASVVSLWHVHWDEPVGCCVHAWGGSASIPVPWLSPCGLAWREGWGQKTRHSWVSLTS